MLNRLYIVVGVLAILAIAAAFFVPRFIAWGDYRDRMEALASELLGAPVAIVGDIEFSLLPQPQLSFTDLRVGDSETPVATVAGVQAQFSLVEFLRDRYHITELVLDRPSLTARVSSDGRIVAGFGVHEQETESTVSVANARIVDGSAVLFDDRSGTEIDVADIEGELRIEALRGPFNFSGTGVHDGATYRGRISTSALGPNGDAQLSLLLAPADDSYVVTAEGYLASGDRPTFDGTLTYRRAPQVDPAAPASDEDIGRGPLVITGKVLTSPARVLLSDFTIVPDENRPATRLNGVADVTLGANQTFSAVISGGILALPPRGGAADPATLPYDFVRLLGELPAPPIPGLAGTLGIDIAEVNLRAVSLRNVRLDATSDGAGWNIDMLSAQLPGGASLTLDGRLTEVGGRPEFGGMLNVAAPRVGALAQLWQSPAGSGTALDVPGELNARVSIVGPTLSLSGGTLSIEDVQHVFDSEIGFGANDRHLDLNATLGAMSLQQSAALLGLLPDIGGNGQFGVTFARARFDVSAREAVLDGLLGTNLAARGSWEGGVLTFERLAGELGGVGFEGALTAFGTVLRPEVSGGMRIAVSAPRAPGLQRLYDLMQTPEPVRDWLDRSLPADLEFGLDPPAGDGGQDVHVTGRAGAADVKLDADVDAGFLRAFSGAISARLDVHSREAGAFTAQLGLGDTSLTPADEPVRMVAVIDGNAVNSFATTVRIEGGRDSLGFSGNIVAGNLVSASGNGALQISLSEPRALAHGFGATGISLPPLNGSARLEFVGGDLIKVDEIALSSGGERASGALQYAREGGVASISGALKLGKIAPDALLTVAAGPVVPEVGAGLWPSQQFDIGATAPSTNGRIEIEAEAIGQGDTALVADPRFTLVWDGSSIRLRDFKGQIGDGTLSAEVGLCCAGGLPQKELSGRVSLAEVAVRDLLPSAVGDVIGAQVTAAARFSGTGDSLARAIATMTGEGSFTLTDLGIDGLSPAAFDAVASIEDVLGAEPADVSDLVSARLGAGRFSATDVHGSFTIAGGVLRSPNLAITGGDARLFGGATLRLTDFALGGSFAMSPTRPSGPQGMLTEANTQIVANLSGTLEEPEQNFDVSGMVDTIMVNAYEIEVARLERIREEDEARAAAAAEERRRVAEQEAARRAAEEAERIAAEQEAERQAEEAADDAAAQESPSEVVLQPGFNLGPSTGPASNLF